MQSESNGHGSPAVLKMPPPSPRAPREKVWITGVGTATALGSSYREFADNLLAGKSGIVQVGGFDVSNHPSQVAGQMADVPCPSGEDLLSFRQLHRLEQLTRWCCVQALRDADLWDRRTDLRVGLVLGVGAEWLLIWESDAAAGGKRVNDPAGDTVGLLERTRLGLDLSGPAVSVSAACASGNYAINQARAWLEMGWVDVCLAGACDMGVSSMSLAGFGNLRALSRRNQKPAAASRPFDRGRDGFVMGEGGAVFVLERARSARQRRARVFGELAGFGASSDAFHMVIPSPDPGPAAAAMRQALNDARLEPSSVDYVNAHATGTPVGDAAEARILNSVFEEHTASLPVSSTKSMTGHLLTAAAAVEALACLAAMERATIPPTINLDDPDPECKLCHVPNTAMSKTVRVALSNSFGFGGSNTCLALRAV
jgi:3-oxoacyl-[acyl-carrier-protein] synthase II